MNVTIEIHYISNDIKVMRAGSFPSKSKNPEQVALKFWNQIKREIPFGAQLEKVFVDGEEQTDKIKELEKTTIE